MPGWLDMQLRSNVILVLNGKLMYRKESLTTLYGSRLDENSRCGKINFGPQTWKDCINHEKDRDRDKKN
jgi:hypothetical protein